MKFSTIHCVLLSCSHEQLCELWQVTNKINFEKKRNSFESCCLLLIDMCPKNASYYGNRAATLMMLSRYREALEDSQQAVRLDDTFMKVDFTEETTPHL